MKVNIDDKSGFCWGVVRTVEQVEQELKSTIGKDVYVLGDIIHNPKEIERLEEIGMKTIQHDHLETLNPEESKVIIRAHGEPPSTYEKTLGLKLETVDATCPLVTNLQKRVKKFYDKGAKVLIYGKPEHAEVIGIRGVCNNECEVVKSYEEAKEKLDFDRLTVLFSQTTMESTKYDKICEDLTQYVKNVLGTEEIKDKFQAHNSICRFVSDRDDNLVEFSNNHDVVIFVAGRNSSNGKRLFNICATQNKSTFFIEDVKELDFSWFDNAETVGITGATSTPQWYLEKVQHTIEEHFA